MISLAVTTGIFSDSPYWQDVNKESIVPKGERYILASAFRTIYLNKYEFFGVINNVPKEVDVNVRNSNSIFSFPMPNGQMSRFKVVESPVMEPELAAKFPEIKTYLGQCIDDPYATIRFDYTPLGFHAMILSPNGTVFIDPYSMNETDYYMSYYTIEMISILQLKNNLSAKLKN